MQRAAPHPASASIKQAETCSCQGAREATGVYSGDGAAQRVKAGGDTGVLSALPPCQVTQGGASCCSALLGRACPAHVGAGSQQPPASSGTGLHLHHRDSRGQQVPTAGSAAGAGDKVSQA